MAYCASDSILGINARKVNILFLGSCSCSFSFELFWKNNLKFLRVHLVALLLVVLVPPPHPPWTNILPVVTTVTLLQYCLVERQCLSRKQDEAYLCGNRKEIITAAHLVLVGLGCESGGGPLGHQVRIALHEIYVYINQRTHLANCVHNRKKLLIASNDRDGAAANRLHGTESDLYRGRLKLD